MGVRGGRGCNRGRRRGRDSKRRGGYSNGQGLGEVGLLNGLGRQSNGWGRGETEMGGE